MHFKPYQILAKITVQKLQIPHEQLLYLLELSKSVTNWRQVPENLLWNTLSEFLEKSLVVWILVMRRTAFTSSEINYALLYLAEQELPPTKIQCITAVALTEGRRNALKESLQNNYPSASIIFQTDCRLLGGLLLKTDFWEIDHSIKSRIRNLMRS